MTFNEYQKLALKTAFVDPKFKNTLMEKTIWAMGVSGEAGEVIDKWKKIVAYSGGTLSKADKDLLQKELGDVIWYLAVFADSLNLSFQEIIDLNLAKLIDRQKRSVIKGSGDNR